MTDLERQTEMDILINEFKKQLKFAFGEDTNLIFDALDFAIKYHEGQTRVSGEAYIIHPINVAQILLKLRMDEATISAALLHDVVEDTPATYKQIKEMFGQEIEELVKGVTKIGNLKVLTHEEREMESLRRMLIVTAKDIRVIIIKIADRLHNLRTLQYLSREKQIRVASQTMDILIPITERLGIGWIKDEMEDWCFKYLYPDDYLRLSKEMERKYHFRSLIIEKTRTELQKIVNELELNCEIQSRIKRLYSIFKKEQSKGMDKIYDIIAHRLICDDVKDCYALLGAVHNRFRPVPGRIKDYIASPKANMYQSLHTTVLSDDGVPFEVQIRTREMHKLCEYGIAAHWRYKEGVTSQSSLDEKIAWIRKAVESERDFKDSESFVEAMKTDFRTNEIWVFTPKLKVINLTEKSTPIDFAYAIHTDLGNKCIGAKVNNKIVPLNTKLETGDVVEIITSQVNKGPSRDWLKIVGTASARNKIRSYFKKEMKEENIKIGKEMLEMEAQKRGYVLSDILTNEAISDFKTRYNLLNLEDVYATVGCGGLTTNQILSSIVSKKKHETRKLFVMERSVQKGNDKGYSSSILVDGKDDFLVKFAGCCSPVPGDDIIGYVSQGKGIIIHSANCPNARKLDKNRMIKVEWKGNSMESNFKGVVYVTAGGKKSILSDVTTLLSQMKISMQNMTLNVDQNGVENLILKLNVKSSNELKNVMDKITLIDGVIKVYRK